MPVISKRSFHSDLGCSNLPGLTLKRRVSINPHLIYDPRVAYGTRDCHHLHFLSAFCEQTDSGAHRIGSVGVNINGNTKHSPGCTRYSGVFGELHSLIISMQTMGRGGRMTIPVQSSMRGANSLLHTIRSFLITRHLSCIALSFFVICTALAFPLLFTHDPVGESHATPITRMDTYSVVS